MTNIIDYLYERGDLRFSQSELNEVDMLIFSQLAHSPLERLFGRGSGSSLAELEPIIYSIPPDKDANELEQLRYRLWQAAARAQRYSGITLGSFESHFDAASEKQFAAVMLMLGSMGIVAFRGTDATLVGWKEDFNMSFESPVPSQSEAVRFINGIDDGVQALCLCGHSKGGNLALYSASMCASGKRRLIKGVYSFDGPGLDDAAASSAGYAELGGRVRSYLPESSIIGLLMDYHDDYFIIESDGVSIWQHNPYLWHVSGAHFVAAEGMTRSSRFAERTLHAFLADCTSDERRMLVDTLYGILAVSKVVRLRDLPLGLALHAPQVLDALRGVQPAAREVLRKALTSLASAGAENLGVLLGLQDEADADGLSRNSGLSM